MRKALAIVVLVSYMLCAFGIRFSFHHCKGELKYVNVHSEKKKKCCKGKKMPKGCCKTVTVAFKKSDDKGQSFFAFTAKALGDVKAIVSYPIVHSTRHVPYQRTCGNHRLRPPPLRTGNLPLYAAYSVYRI